MSFSGLNLLGFDDETFFIFNLFFSTLIAAFSKHGEMDTAERLFAKAMHMCYEDTEEHCRVNRKALLVLTQCLLDGYASLGRVDECVDVLRQAMERTHPQFEWNHFPTPNVHMAAQNDPLGTGRARPLPTDVASVPFPNGC